MRLNFKSILSGGLVLGCLFITPLMAQAEDAKTLSYDAMLTNYEYAYKEPVQFYEFESQKQKLKMAYVVLKGLSDHPAITLLHGKNFNADYWAETAEFLNEEGYTVIVPDQIGFGKSSKPMAYQYSFASLAQHTKGLLESLGIESSIIIGHSMGGMLASRFALQYPQMTQKLILVNPIGLENYLQYVDYKDVDFFYKNELAKTPEKIYAYQKANYYDGQWTDKYQKLTNFMVGQVQGPEAEKIAWVNAMTYDMIFTQPVVNDLKDLTVPTRLILGTRDRTGPGRGWKKEGADHELGRYDKLGGQVIQHIPDAHLYELDGLGHLPQMEDFTRFSIILKQSIEQ